MVRGVGASLIFIILKATWRHHAQNLQKNVEARVLGHCIWLNSFHLQAQRIFNFSLDFESL